MNLFLCGIHVSGTKDFFRSVSGRGFAVCMIFVSYFDPYFLVAFPKLPLVVSEEPD